MGYTPIPRERAAAKPGAARPGRPTKVGPDLAREVARLVAEGLTLREVAARVGVHPRTLLRRAAADAGFRARYAEARACALRALLDELDGLARSGAPPREVAAARRRLMRRAPKQHGRPEGDRTRIRRHAYGRADAGWRGEPPRPA